MNKNFIYNKDNNKIINMNNVIYFREGCSLDNENEEFAMIDFVSEFDKSNHTYLSTITWRFDSIEERDNILKELKSKFAVLI